MVTPMWCVRCWRRTLPRPASWPTAHHGPWPVAAPVPRTYGPITSARSIVPATGAASAPTGAAAGKAAGNGPRACLEYFKLHIPQLTIPLTCVVDYHGFRVLCVAKLPLEITVHADTGEVRKCYEDMVIGTNNRGETIVSSNRVADNKLAEAARPLNLARHGVKGQKDILNKFLSFFKSSL